MSTIHLIARSPPTTIPMPETTLVLCLLPFKHVLYRAVRASLLVNLPSIQQLPNMLDFRLMRVWPPELEGGLISRDMGTGTRG